MGPKPHTPKSDDLFRQRLDDLINPRHSLVQLAQHIDWSVFEREWISFFPSHCGRPATAPRLVAGLLYLQHAFALSDEEVVRCRVENPYWQLFCGETWFQHYPPIDSSSLTRWRQRIGVEGIEWFLAQTIKAAVSAKVPQHLKPKVSGLLQKVERLLKQQPKDSHKLYSLHASEVECISKGKSRQPYEFEVKVSVMTTHKEGLVVGMRSLPGNPYDGHTLHLALKQAAILTQRQPKEVFVDLGYRGATVPAGVKVYHRKLRRGITARLKRDIRRRSAIEPAIGHMKNDGRLRRNWLQGTAGDAFHAMLCGCGHNLRMILRKLRLLLTLILLPLHRLPVNEYGTTQRLRLAFS